MYLGVAIYATLLSEITSKCLLFILEILQETISLNLTHGAPQQMTSVDSMGHQVKNTLKRWRKPNRNRNKTSLYDSAYYTKLGILIKLL